MVAKRGKIFDRENCGLENLNKNFKNIRDWSENERWIGGKEIKKTFSVTGNLKEYSLMERRDDGGWEGEWKTNIGWMKNVNFVLNGTSICKSLVTVTLNPFLLLLYYCCKTQEGDFNWC